MYDILWWHRLCSFGVLLMTYIYFITFFPYCPSARLIRLVQMWTMYITVGGYGGCGRCFSPKTTPSSTTTSSCSTRLLRWESSGWLCLVVQFFIFLQRRPSFLEDCDPLLLLHLPPPVVVATLVWVALASLTNTTGCEEDCCSIATMMKYYDATISNY